MSGREVRMLNRYRTEIGNLTLAKQTPKGTFSGGRTKNILFHFFLQYISRVSVVQKCLIWPTSLA